jgi:hypothetical protein
MRSIARKRLVALLSLAGLAGTTTSATAQAVKGSNEATKTTTESTRKTNKTVLENHAGASQTATKIHKTGAAQYPIEHGKEASLTANKTNAKRKQSKNASEAHAAVGAGMSKDGKNSLGKNTQNGTNTKTYDSKQGQKN